MMGAVIMKIIKTERRLCTCCMEEHNVKMVSVGECTTFKNVKVEYDATYLYCDKADEYYMDEQLIQENDLRLKNEYRKQEGLLTSVEISDIRAKYGISQSDFCVLLGWGGKTITRYEGHQVQDRAHDTILKKIDGDSEWFISLLHEAKDSISEISYFKYLERATSLYESNQDNYLRKTIESNYIRFRDNSLYNGNVQLSLDKVVDVIRYFAASEYVTNLYKVKLMKLMWYADALSYKNRGHAITGLVYKSMPMGAVPVGHNLIIDLQNVPCEEIDMGETNAYYFSLNEQGTYPALLKEDKDILDIVIEKLGKMSKSQIVSFMHQEIAYTETAQGNIIKFNYAENLKI